MTSGKDVAIAPRAVASGARESVWTCGVNSGPRRPSPGGTPGAAPDLAELASATVTVRTALAEMTVAAQVAVARARAIVAVMDAAVAVLEGAERATMPEATSGVGARHGSVLSPREREVLALVAQGRSNKAIAEALFLSPNTIKTHVASLMTKLEADSRVQLAAIATRQELHRNELPMSSDHDGADTHLPQVLAHLRGLSSM